MSRRKPFEGFWSTQTQIVANELPQWHVIRTNPDSKGQQLLNSAGMSLEYEEWMLVEARKNSFIGTADTLTRWEGYGLSLPQTLIQHIPRNTNILRNASFKDPGIAHRIIPREWATENATHYLADSKHGHGCVKLEVANGETGKLSQEIEGEFQSGRQYTASVFVKADGAYTGEDSGFTLTANGSGWGTSVGSSNTTLPIYTGGEWLQYETTLTLSSRANVLNFEIELLNASGATVTIKVSAPQLGVGASIQPWQPHPIDLQLYSFRLAMYGATGEEQEKIELTRAYTLADFYEDAPPTRISATLGYTGELLSYDEGQRVQEWNKQEWDSGYRLGTTTDIEHYNKQITAEVFYSYRVADRYIGNEDGTGEYGFLADEEADYSRTWEAMTVWRRRIYALCRETKAGTTYRTLKIINSFGLSGEMEVLTDVLVGMDTGEVEYLGFIDGHMEKMVMKMTDGSYWTLGITFDYFYFDPDTNQVLVRHPYTNMTPTFIEF